MQIENKNMALLLNRPMPLKILYLKESQNPLKTQQKQQQQPSLAYLSSIIQDEKERKQANHIQNIFQTQSFFEYPEANTLKQDQKITAKQLRFLKKIKTKSENKNNLNNIIGNSLDTYPKLNLIKTLTKSLHRPSKKDEKRYTPSSKNKLIFQESFNQYVSNKNVSPNKSSQEQILKDGKQRAQSTSFLQSNFETIKSGFDRYVTKNHKSDKKPRTAAQIGPRKAYINSIMARKNFKHVNDFSWSKIHQGNIFNIKKFQQKLTDKKRHTLD